MAQAYSIFLGRAYVPSYDFDVNVTTKSTTAGYYYPKGYTGESPNQLMEHMTDLLNDVVAGATCTLDFTNGLVTIDFNSTTTSVTWTDTTLRDILGFASNLSGSDAYVSAFECKYVWRPTRYLSSHTVDRDLIWEDESNTRTVLSMDGTAYSIAGNTRYVSEVSFSHLAKARVVDDASTNNETFQSFYGDVLALGQSVRYVPDIGSYASTSNYGECLVGNGEDALGPFTDYATRSVPGFGDLWDVSFPLVKYA